MKTTTISPDFIQWHRLLDDMPIWSDDSTEMNALVGDIRERGIDQPLIVCRTEDGGETPGSLYLLDGRNRHRAALLAGLSEVPIVERDEAAAVGIILSSLTQRRHYSKGALAYICYPILAAVRAKGGWHGNQHQKVAIPPQADLPTEHFGFSEDTYEQAKKTHKFFADDAEYRWSNKVTSTGRVERMTCREMWESRLLAGEVGIKAINCACGFVTRSLGGEIKQIESDRLESRNDHLKYITQAWDKTIFHHVKCLTTEADRREAADIIAQSVLALPEDIFGSIATEITKAVRARRKEAA